MEILEVGIMAADAFFIVGLLDLDHLRTHVGELADTGRA